MPAEDNQLAAVALGLLQASKGEEPFALHPYAQGVMQAAVQVVLLSDSTPELKAANFLRTFGLCVALARDARSPQAAQGLARALLEEPAVRRLIEMSERTSARRAQAFQHFAAASEVRCAPALGAKPPPGSIRASSLNPSRVKRP